MKNCINDFSLSISQGLIKDPYGAVGLVRYIDTRVPLGNFCCVVCAVCAWYICSGVSDHDKKKGGGFLLPLSVSIYRGI